MQSRFCIGLQRGLRIFSVRDRARGVAAIAPDLMPSAETHLLEASQNSLNVLSGIGNETIHVSKFLGEATRDAHIMEGVGCQFLADQSARGLYRGESSGYNSVLSQKLNPVSREIWFHCFLTIVLSWRTPASKPWRLVRLVQTSAERARRWTESHRRYSPHFASKTLELCSE